MYVGAVFFDGYWLAKEEVGRNRKGFSEGGKDSVGGESRVLIRYGTSQSRVSSLLVVRYEQSRGTGSKQNGRTSSSASGNVWRQRAGKTVENKGKRSPGVEGANMSDDGHEK